MPTSLNIIALISGGKDSFFSILHCLHHGHRVVAIANLCPPDDDVRHDMESMMYQTIGHNVIDRYGECLGLPLYRYAIEGTALNTQPDYSQTAGDETERIREMLMLIINNHPEANAVSTGAIMSDYQRTRVESVAARLHLTPISFLWQYPILPPPAERSDSVSGLLDDMAAAGCDARIIKTAHGNFDDSLIGQNVADPRTIARLTKLSRRWVARNERELRATIVGEGGEYETITVDGPYPVWKWYMPVEASDFKVIERQGYTVYGSLPESAIAEKSEPDADSPQPVLRIPTLLDSQFEAVRLGLSSCLEDISDAEKLMSNASFRDSAGYVPTAGYPFIEAHTEHHIAVGNIRSDKSLDELNETLNALFKNLSSLCQRGHDTGLGVRDVTSVVLQLANMHDFADVNEWYQKYFDVINPPARVTISSDLPIGVSVTLSMIIDLRNNRTRRALHVQSRSYWAPANIGPYSQAIAEALSTPHGNKPSMPYDNEPELVHMAGQIPLVPQTMEILQGPFLLQAVLSLQHLWRVGQERKVDLWAWGVAFVPIHTENFIRAHTAIAVWQKAHSSLTRPPEDDEEQDIDPWDAQQNFQYDSQHSAIMAGQGSHLHVLPGLDAFQSGAAAQLAPPCIVAEVLELPRSAPVEWWSTGLANLPKKPARVTAGGVCSADLDTNVTAVHSLKYMSRADGEGRTDNDGANFITVTFFPSDNNKGPEQLRDWVGRLLALSHDDGNPKRRVVHGTCFTTARDEGRRVYEGLVKETWMSGIPVIQCRRLFVDDVRGRHDCTATTQEAVMVLLLRTEEVEPKRLEKEHGRQT